MFLQINKKMIHKVRQTSKYKILNNLMEHTIKLTGGDNKNFLKIINHRMDWLNQKL